jgi:cell division protein FtsN
MKIKYVFLLAGLLLASGCKTKKMTAVEQPVQEKPLIEKETEIAVEVDQSSNIMAMEERFNFLYDDDRNRYDEKVYFIIMGSFRRKDNAEKFMETLKRKGFEPVILISETGLHRVSVDSYNAEAEAREKIVLIKSRYREHADAWLLIRNRN